MSTETPDGRDVTCSMRITAPDVLVQRWTGQHLFVLLEVQATPDGAHVQIAAGGGFPLESGEVQVVQLLKDTVEMLTDPETTATVTGRG